MPSKKTRKKGELKDIVMRIYNGSSTRDIVAYSFVILLIAVFVFAGTTDGLERLGGSTNLDNLQYLDGYYSGDIYDAAVRTSGISPNVLLPYRTEAEFDAFIDDNPYSDLDEVELCYEHSSDSSHCYRIIYSSCGSDGCSSETVIDTTDSCTHGGEVSHPKGDDLCECSNYCNV